MTHVLVYDIASDRVRGRAAGLLEGYGRRVQESVFECRFEPRELEGLIDSLKRELSQRSGGQVRIYRVCDSCMKASIGVGRVEHVDTAPCYVI